MTSLLKQVSRLGSVASLLSRKCLQSCEPKMIQPAVLVNRVSQVSFTTTPVLAESSQRYQSQDYSPPSPYKQPGPRRYGYINKMFAGGLLPRPNIRRPLPLPKYKPKDSWAKKRALFGQNDYIDILGDGDVHPVDLMKGPGWLIGFRGNELQRLTRRLRFEGRRMRILYPTQYHQLKKRIYFLYKKYNGGRRSPRW